MTTGPTYRLRLELERADAEVEAEMAKSRFDALGLAPGALVTLRLREFGLFPAAGTNPAGSISIPEVPGSPREVAAA
jgi:hypothetical protein